MEEMDLKTLEVWFVTGSQHLYGKETLKQVDLDSETIAKALDASSYIKPENLEISHLVVLPEYFEEQQDKVWEVLRTLGIDNLHYHNIFYAESADPKKVAEVIRIEIEKYKKMKN